MDDAQIIELFMTVDFEAQHSTHLIIASKKFKFKFGLIPLIQHLSVRYQCIPQWNLLNLIDAKQLCAYDKFIAVCSV